MSCIIRSVIFTCVPLFWAGDQDRWIEKIGVPAQNKTVFILTYENSR